MPLPLAAIVRPGASALIAFGQGLRSLVYPAACVACSAVVPEEGLPLCPACLAALDVADVDALRTHLAPVAVLDTVWAAWRYDPDGPLGALLHAIKYGHRPRYARLLGHALASRLPAAPLDALVPIPLTRARWLDRGYNQAEEVAHGLGAARGLPVRSDLLRRTGFVGSQTRLSRGARRANVAHAFHAQPEAAGLHLALVDDVVTTGATTGAAAEALRRAGAASVSLIAAAWTR